MTNREIFFESHEALCESGDFEAYADFLGKLAEQVDLIILREKNLSVLDYEILAGRVLDCCGKNREKVVLHSYIEAAVHLDWRAIHLPMKVFEDNLQNIAYFQTLGMSAHSLEDAAFAERNGASYITASHIYATDCKRGAEPKGLGFLREVCEKTEIPVYALGGISEKNESETIKAGAAGACRMSDYMRRSIR